MTSNSNPNNLDHVVENLDQSQISTITVAQELKIFLGLDHFVENLDRSQVSSMTVLQELEIPASTTRLMFGYHPVRFRAS